MKIKIGLDYQADVMEFVRTLNTVDKEIENSIGFQFAPLIISHSIADILFVDSSPWWIPDDSCDTEAFLDDMFPLGLQIGFYTPTKKTPKTTAIVLWNHIRGITFLEPITLATVCDSASNRILDPDDAENIAPPVSNMIYPGQWKDED